MELIERKIKVNGLELHFVEAGEGEVMIFMHNGGGFWQSWEHQLNYFKATHKVIGLDWPGFGESELPQGMLTLDLLTETLKRFIEIRGFEKVILVGNCIGASAALKYTIENPLRVKKLVVMNVCPGDHIFPPFIFRKWIPKVHKKPRLQKRLSSLAKFIVSKTPAKRQFPKILFAKRPDRSTALWKKYEIKFKTENQTTSRLNLFFSAHTYNLLKYLPKENIPPMLLVWGKENAVTKYKTDGLYHVAKLKPEKFVLIDKGGHLFMYEKPDEVNALIVNYISN
ncbi:MAG TPA: alpha/beta hydrolase [Flavobacteriales bacterium]|nr:alpha/beta hydrolase [Flavobacteriales bacterium]